MRVSLICLLWCSSVIFAYDNPNDFVFPQSSTKKIPWPTGYSLEQLAIGRNEIYARHGYTFKNQELKAYFNSKSWYQEKTANEQAIQLNEIERYNVKLLKQREDETKLAKPLKIVSAIDFTPGYQVLQVLCKESKRESHYLYVVNSDSATIELLEQAYVYKSYLIDSRLWSASVSITDIDLNLKLNQGPDILIKIHRPDDYVESLVIGFDQCGKLVRYYLLRNELSYTIPLRNQETMLITQRAWGDFYSYNRTYCFNAELKTIREIKLDYREIFIQTTALDSVKVFKSIKNALSYNLESEFTTIPPGKSILIFQSYQPEGSFGYERAIAFYVCSEQITGWVYLPKDERKMRFSYAG